MGRIFARCGAERLPGLTAGPEPTLLRLLPSVSSSLFLAERTAQMPAPRKPESPHRLSLKLGPWFEAHGTGGGVLAIVFVVVGFGLGRAWGIW